MAETTAGSNPQRAHAEIYRDRLEAIEAIEAFAHDPAAFGAVPGNPDYDQPMGAARRARELAYVGAMLLADLAEHRNAGIAEILAERRERARAALDLTTPGD